MCFSNVRVTVESRLPCESRVMPPWLTVTQQAMLPQSIICIGSPLMSGAKVCDPHVSRQSPQQLDHPQDKEHIWGEVLHCHLLHRAIRIKGINPGSTKEQVEAVPWSKSRLDMVSQFHASWCIESNASIQRWCINPAITSEGASPTRKSTCIIGVSLLGPAGT